MIRKYWPLFIAIAVVITSIILGVIASKSTDTGEVIFAGVIIFMFLLPLAGVLFGAWCGWEIRSPLKWAAAPAAYLAVAVCLVASDLVTGAQEMDLSGSCSVASFTGIAALAAEAVASLIAWLVRRKLFSA